MSPFIVAAAVFFPTISLPGDANSSQDPRINVLLREVINHGADLYNRGDANGCYRLYEGTLITVRELADRHADWQQTIDDAFERAELKRSVSQRAFVLREVLDRLRTDCDASAKR